MIDPVVDLIIDPFQYAFMQRALLAAAIAATVCAVVGTFVVLRGLAFMGDAVAHSSLTGVATAYVLGGSVFWGALAWAVPASITIAYISRRTQIRLDASVGIVYGSWTTMTTPINNAKGPVAARMMNRSLNPPAFLVLGNLTSP